MAKKCCGDCTVVVTVNNKEVCVPPNLQSLYKKHGMLVEKMKLNSQRLKNMNKGGSDDIESATAQQKEIQDAISKTLNNIQVIEKQNKQQKRYDCTCRKS